MVRLFTDAPRRAVSETDAPRRATRSANRRPRTAVHNTGIWTWTHMHDSRWRTLFYEYIKRSNEARDYNAQLAAQLPLEGFFPPPHIAIRSLDLTHTHMRVHELVGLITPYNQPLVYPSYLSPSFNHSSQFFAKYLKQLFIFNFFPHPSSPSSGSSVGRAFGCYEVIFQVTVTERSRDRNPPGAQTFPCYFKFSPFP
jgi:hypothetical protein